MDLALETSGPLPAVPLHALGALTKVPLRATGTLAGPLHVSKARTTRTSTRQSISRPATPSMDLALETSGPVPAIPLHAVGALAKVS
jgi:hypothetical protein